MKKIEDPHLRLCHGWWPIAFVCGYIHGTSNPIGNKQRYIQPGKRPQFVNLPDQGILSTVGLLLLHGRRR